MEVGLLQQIYTLIEDAGDYGATIVEMRNQIVLPGSKLPYKLVSMLAGTYGLRAETIILGKNKAFRLFANSDGKNATNTQAEPSLELPENGNNDSNSSVAMNEAHDVGTPHKDKEEQAHQDKDTPQTLRASTTLKGAFGGGVEVRGTRARRRKHILERLALEKIISISSLRASVFGMEKQVAAAAELVDAQEQQPPQQPGAFVSVTSAAVAAVGMVDTRSISRIAEELEREGSLRLLQLPLPAKNVSTKFRALKCVVCPGYEQNETFIQQFVKNYCRDERLRRVHQNTERNQVIRLRTLESDDESEATKAFSPSVAAGATEVAADNDGTLAIAGGGDNNQRRVKRRLDVDGGSVHDQSGQFSGSQDGEAFRDMNSGQAAPIEISYRIRRFVNQAKSGIHTHQYRTLGFAYGVMYRCKVFHKFLWAFLHDTENNHAQLRDEATDLSIDDEEESSEIGDPSHRSGGIVFSRETVLHSMPVHLYIQVFSGGEILSPTELAIVEDAIANKRFFHDLPDALRDKIWSHESQRTAKVLGTLTDLELIHPHKIGMKSLIKILRAGYTDGRDGVLSRALKDNALGGLFRLRSQTRIVLDDKNGDHVRFYPPGEQQADGEPRKRVNELNELRLVGTTEKHYSFSNLLPLRFTFDTEANVDRYWEALECLCLEQMVMEVSKPKRNEPAVCEVPKPAKTRARRMLRILAWISKSRKPASKAAASGNSAEENGKTAASKRVEKRNGIVSKTYTPRLKRRQAHSNKDTASGPAVAANTTDSEKADEEAHSKPHRALQRRSTGVQTQASAMGSTENKDGSKSNSLLWTDENERNLLSFFIENCKSRWKIAIPLGLQRESEQIAFRNPSLSRSGFGLVTIARKLGKRRIDVKKRLKEKLTEPAAKLLFENAKRETTLREHPGGVFDEEVTILQSARLTALFRRAVMMVVSPQEEYHPLVAEELISFWTAQEIRLVWRYLWLKNWIVRATEKEKIRGYTTSQRLQDSLKLTTLSYPLWLFRQAAEQESMIHSTLEEITTSSSHSGVNGAVTNGHHAKERGADAPNSTDQLFEAEFPTNATPGQCALELACQVMGTCTLTATHCPHGDTDDDNDVSDNGHASDERTSSHNKVSSRKRNLRFLNYKSLKGGGSGFAAHLAKHVHFKKPSVLIDNWHVDTQLHAVTLEDKEQMRHLEAFSTADDEDNDGLGTIAFLPFKKRKKAQDVLERAVMHYVQASGEAGITLAEVVHKLHHHHLSNGNDANNVNDQADEELRSVAAATVGRCLNTLVDDGAVLCVNAYFDQRFIVKDHGDVWLLRPFSLVTSSESTTGSTTGSTNGATTSNSLNAVKSRVVFEGEKDTLSFPWLKMDGSTNYKFLFSIQRKLLSLILMAPGITEQSVYLKMDKLLTLQDTREALALLVEEGLVYVRGTTSGSSGSSRLSLFSKPRKRRRADSEDATVTRSSGGTRVVNLVGNVLNFDREMFVVHYFPHLECIQRFGSIVQDYQNEVAEFHHRTP
uniref:GTF3C1 extended winged-helix domain-containing protein n=1 Tax=Globisporangium ultimum (strain ATCC 200006 / CBS 805.95 / DAOM BR144) TaxID=431595 RepID=K3X2B2_GLOUD